MRIPESDQDSGVSVSLDSAPEAGPSSILSDKAGPSNGHVNGNGFSLLATNGSTNGSSSIGNGTQKHKSPIARVSLPGTSLYGDPYIDRQEFVRLVIQSLRDVGYIESAATLEAESGYSLELPEATEFRRHILDGSWTNAESLLPALGVASEEYIWESKFLIGQQKYLELLEARKTTAALQVLRNELAPLHVDPDQLHSLSSLMMCSDSEDLRQRAGWDGASGASRQELLIALQRYISPAIMLPQRRFATLLAQSREYQRQHCNYHNSPMIAESFSLFSDHQCNKNVFPRITTTILEVHTDEVWGIAWSHDGQYLASASKDKSAIIWRVPHDAEPPLPREPVPLFVLRDHPYPVGCLAWSLDDSILLTGSDHLIKMWNAKTGACIRQLETHSETVTALEWLPDDSGFISGGLDRKIVIWDADGKQRDTWGPTAMRITDLAITPDLTRVVAIGMEQHHAGVMALPTETVSTRGNTHDSSPPLAAGGSSVVAESASWNAEHMMVVFGLETKKPESCAFFRGELTSVKISYDSRYALLNHAPDEIYLWDLDAGRTERRFMGQRQGHHVIRSCFGGVDGNFIVSGSEDGKVYIWDCDKGILLEVLGGHGNGSVNSVAWNPRNERMFASCSDDNTIRLWEAEPILVVEFTPPGSPGGSQADSSSKGKGKVSEDWDGAGDAVGA